MGQPVPRNRLFFSCAGYWLPILCMTRISFRPGRVNLFQKFENFFHKVVPESGSGPKWPVDQLPYSAHGTWKLHAPPTLPILVFQTDGCRWVPHQFFSFQTVIVEFPPVERFQVPHHWARHGRRNHRCPRQTTIRCPIQCQLDSSHSAHYFISLNSHSIFLECAHVPLDEYFSLSETDARVSAQGRTKHLFQKIRWCVLTTGIFPIFPHFLK